MNRPASESQQSRKVLGIWLLAELAVLAALAIVAGYNWANSGKRPSSVMASASSVDPGDLSDQRRIARVPTPDDYRTIPAITDEELVQNKSISTGNNPNEFNRWYRSQGDLGSTRYSTLEQINKSNVGRLKPVWQTRIDRHQYQLQGSAIFVNGLVISVTSGNSLVALDPLTGDIRWKYFSGKKQRLGQRGMAFRPSAESGGGTIFLSSGHRLIAINPADGRLRQSFGNSGIAELYNGARIAPVFFENLVIIATLQPNVQAVDVYSGERVWLKKLTPVDGKSTFAAPWAGMSVDQDRGLVFVTMGNPKPALDGRNRAGDNAYSDSLVAINAVDGSIKWAFQEVRHDLWDLDLPTPPMLTSIKTRNFEEKIDVVVAPTKAGNTLLLDRVSGKPIFDFRLRKAPRSAIEFEETAEFQPDLELPEPFARQEFKMSDVTDISAVARDDVLERVKAKSIGFFTPPDYNQSIVYFGVAGGAGWPGGAVDAESGYLYLASNHIPFEARYEIEVAPIGQRAYSFLKNTYRATTGKRKISVAEYDKFCSSCHGSGKGEASAPSLRKLKSRYSRAYVAGIIRNGKSGMPAVSDISDNEINNVLNYLFSARNGNRRFFGQPSPEKPMHMERFLDNEGYPASKPPWGSLNCINLNTGEIVWKVPLGEYAELTRRGLPVTGAENIGGPLVTAGGLVFVAGTPDKMFRVFDSETGQELWKYELPFVGTAPPITYEFEGKQYVFIAATGGGNMAISEAALPVKSGNAFVAFALE